MLKADRSKAAESNVIALQLLGFIAENKEILGRFMALTGSGPDDLRNRLEDPDFHAAILEFVMQDENLLLAFAAQQEIDPQIVARAYHALQGPLQ